MASFTKNSAARAPFGINEYLRSVRDIKTESYTFAKNGIPYSTRDGDLVKELQPGTVIAKITSGPDAGKVGVFQAGGTDEAQTLTGTTVTAGTYTLTVLGQTTTAIQWNAVAATVQAAIRAAVALSTNETYRLIGDDLTVTGGPVSTTPLVVTFNGEYGLNVDTITIDQTLLTGTIAATTGTPGVAGATDGRESTANIVGIVDTFLPWQLLERDVEVAVVYEATVVQAWCFEYNTTGSPTALGNTTRDAMVALPSLAILFK